MRISFAEALRRLRTEKGISQQRLADMIHVDRSSLASWETGRRLPDAAMISLLSECLGANVADLLQASEKNDERPNIIIVDDENIILGGEIAVVSDVLPSADVRGFIEPDDAIRFIKENHVQLVFLDIEMGHLNGLDLCREILTISPQTNVIYLTAFREYSFDAWSTNACGFLLKPLNTAAVHEALTHLRHPIRNLPEL